MTEPTLDALTRRLDRLERENRRWRAITVVVIAGLGLSTLLGATSAKAPEEVRAKRFVVIDGTGKQRAVLGERAPGRYAHPFGKVGLYLLDKKGEPDWPSVFLMVLDEGAPKLGFSDGDKVRVWLHASKDASILSLWPGQGKANVTVMSSDSAQSVMLSDKQDKARTWLRIDNLGFAGLEISDKEQKPRLRLDVLPDGTPRLRFDDRDGQYRAVLALSDFGTPWLNLLARDGAVIWKAP